MIWGVNLNPAWNDRSNIWYGYTVIHGYRIFGDGFNGFINVLSTKSSLSQIILMALALEQLCSAQTLSI